MATSVVDQSTQLESNGSGYSKTSRRQYQSCDQCRKSRRACDAATLRVVNFPLGDDDSPESSDYLVDACSNCSRTNKKCTFEWLRTLPKQSLPKGIKRKLGLSVNDPPHPPAAHPPSNTSEPTYHSHYQNTAGTFNPVSRSSSSAPTYDLQHAHLESQHGTFPGHVTIQNGSVRAWGGQYPQSQHDEDCNPRYPSTQAPYKHLNGSNNAEHLHNDNADPLALTRYDTSSSSSSSNSIRSGNLGANLHGQSQISVTSDSDQERQRQQPPSKLARLTSGDLHDAKSTSSSIPHSRRGSGNRQLPFSKRQLPIPLSPRQVRFADNAMKSMIASGLLRIYHDSFENSLSCWVTEKNCPYERELSDLIQQASPSSMAEEAAYRLCDNRIFSRVSRLDSAFSPLRGRPLTAYENRAASQALNAAIMAFASQWSHSSHNAFWKSKEGKSQIDAWQEKSNDGRPGNSFDDPVITGECERMIQRTLWNEAKTAIQASGEIDSFKVILAYMIFALTQRPVDPKPARESSQQRPREDSISTSNGSRGGWSEAILTDTPSEQYSDPAMDVAMNEEWNPFYANDLEALASPPIYLETAVRNLFNWRRKVERYRRMRSRAQASDSSTPMIGSLALKDQQTFNILFWLGVMCDTTSSAISRRPLVIPDEDCAMIHESMENLSVSDNEDQFGWQPGHPKADADETPDGALWGSYLLGFKYAGPRSTPPRWPCSFEEAALILQEAIPVKVLMFRKVGQLQTLAYRRTAPRNLEKCIEEALAVYQQWNLIYGQFMIDCVNAHNSLPPHVQSWYVILDGHWHYGCLLLADAIASIDREGKTMKPQRDLRSSCGIIVELRHANALAIAKIAGASLSEHSPSFPDNPEFHFACNGSAILTEPWTDILVRAMGSACKIFINWLSTWDNPCDPAHSWVTTHTTYDEMLERAGTCIQGMTLLGRKSDAANFTASVFMDRLNRVTAGRRDSQYHSVP